MSVKPIPAGYHAVTPYLVVRNVSDEIEFLKKAFDAEVVLAVDSPDGIKHAEVKIHDSMIMLGMAQGGKKPTCTMLYLYVPDCDATFSKAMKAGGEVIVRPKDQYYGDRSGAVMDSNGNEWWIATHTEDLSPEEIAKRAKAAHKQTASV
ncbi:MAG TPA: VOC family protein [Candidatus Obscuribacterales bacterium]